MGINEANEAAALRISSDPRTVPGLEALPAGPGAQGWGRQSWEVPGPPRPGLGRGRERRCHRVACELPSFPAHLGGPATPCAFCGGHAARLGGPYQPRAFCGGTGRFCGGISGPRLLRTSLEGERNANAKPGCKRPQPLAEPEMPPQLPPKRCNAAAAAAGGRPRVPEPPARLSGGTKDRAEKVPHPRSRGRCTWPFPP